MKTKISRYVYTYKRIISTHYFTIAASFSSPDIFGTSSKPGISAEKSLSNNRGNIQSNFGTTSRPAFLEKQNIFSSPGVKGGSERLDIRGISGTISFMCMKLCI